MNYYSRPQSDGPFQAPIPASVAESLLDTERIADLIHTAELQDIALSAEQKIKEATTKDGYEQTIDGVALRLSNGYVAGKAQDGRSVYARLYTTVDTKEPIRCGILFDVTPDKAIVTTNLDGITVNNGSIVVGSEFNAGIDVDPDEEVYHYVANVVDTIWLDVTSREKREIEKAESAKLREKRDKEWARARRRRDVKEILVELGAALLPVGIVGIGAAAFVVAAVANEELPEITDKAAVVPISGRAFPAFSSQLYDDEALHRDHIYDIPGNSFEQGDVREFILDSSKPGNNCQTETFDEGSRPSLTSEIRAWTDAVNPDGTPKNGDITVTYTLDELKACWVKDTQKNEEETVRVVVQLTDSATTTTEG